MRRCMNFKRLVMFGVAYALLVAAPPALAQEGGGVAVPTAPPEPATVAQTPTTPEGEEQPPAEEPDGGEQPPSQEPTITPPPEEGNAGGESTGALPQTGWQVFALLSIGLGLLLAGAALWPTSSWPPPRDRLSRSASRR
jgi:hypothetical protein